MENGTYFQLMLLENMGRARYAYFTAALLLYAVILASNGLVVLAIAREPRLHRPMYLLIPALCLNSLLGAAGFFPRFLADTLTDTHYVSRGACLLQAFALFFYAANENSLLTVMALDRYLAVLRPLQYHAIMSPRRLCALMAGSCVYPLLGVGVGSLLNLRLATCGSRIWKIYCNNWEMVKLSCGSTLVNNVYGFFLLATSLLLPLALILYTYVRILLVCRRSSTEIRRKAYRTCVPHVLVLLNFSAAFFCEVALSRLDAQQLPVALSVFLSLEFLVVPPVINPLIYGWGFPEIRRKMFDMVGSLRGSRVKDLT